MSSLFSSPGKTAQQAASAEGDQNTQDIQELQNYTNQQESNLRGAISGLGANPYLTAASSMTPAAYTVNPSNTQTFGSSGPGTMQATNTSTAGSGNPFAPTGTPGQPVSAPVTARAPGP